MKKLVSKLILYMLGWKVVSDIPTLKKYVIIVSPHTSNWDFIIGRCFGYMLEIEAKYLGKSNEITPARISEEDAEKVRREIKKIYKALNMKGLTRTEFILQDGIPYFLEINTNPGLSKESIIPKQIKEIGMSLTDLFDRMIQNVI